MAVQAFQCEMDRAYPPRIDQFHTPAVAADTADAAEEGVRSLVLAGAFALAGT
jgi:hypothetical protein